jgi:hypothetical protein
MLVWGGYDGPYLNTGGRYDPATDTWTATSTAGAPSPRVDHTAVWTGSLMVVWGGREGVSYFNTGGRYDPATDTWTSTSTAGAPSPRSLHTAVWTGSFMLVWGGYDGFYLNTGGRYALGHSSDDDGDGYTECDGDCNDGNPAIYPGAPETNDGQDNQCFGDPGFGLVDEVSGTIGFYNPADNAELSWPAQAGATHYQVIRADTQDFSSGCTLFPQTTNTFFVDTGTPPEGGFYYLVRATRPNSGSWGADGAGVERALLCD